MITHNEKEILVPDRNTRIQIMKKRILSAIFIGLFFISSILLSLPPFTAVMMIVGMIMVFEWYQICGDYKGFLFLGPVIIFPSIISLILVHDPQNKWFILSYFAMIWAVDTFAMLGGVKIGGPRLAPTLSPNKTWSGFITGIIAGSLVFLGSYYLFVKNWIDPDLMIARHVVIFAVTLSCLAQISDLFISYFKRKFHVKDSGNIIPGHGGMLDRFDSIILTAPILFFTIYMP